MSTYLIDGIKAKVKQGILNPMTAKRDLARLIVRDFHSPDAAQKAEQDWSSLFQRHKTRDKQYVPDVIELIQVSYEKVKGPSGRTGYPLRVDKLLAHAGMASSVAEAARKIKQGAVEIDGAAVVEPLFVSQAIPTHLTVRAGRLWKLVTVS